MKPRFTPSHGSQPKQARENRHVQAVEQAVPSLDEDDLMAIVAQKAVPFVLVLDCVQDPHNLGAILRTRMARSAAISGRSGDSWVGGSRKVS